MLQVLVWGGGSYKRLTPNLGILPLILMMAPYSLPLPQFPPFPVLICLDKIFSTDPRICKRRPAAAALEAMAASRVRSLLVVVMRRGQYHCVHVHGDSASLPD